jgi:hypothetical protein
VNLLLPDMFKEIHLDAMRNTHGLYKVSNVIREVMVTKFDGYLTKSKMVIKILPNLNNFMSSVLLLRTQYQKGTCCILLDECLNFNCFDMNFATLLDIEDLMATDVCHTRRISKKFYKDLIGYIKFIKYEELTGYKNVGALMVYCDLIIEQDKTSEVKNCRKDHGPKDCHKPVGDIYAEFRKEPGMATMNTERKTKENSNLSQIELDAVMDLCNPNVGINYQVKKRSMFYRTFGQQLMNIHVEVKSF